jgi:TatD DNase family protein
MMIDAHCHIDQFPKPFEIADKAERDGIITISVTSLPEHFELGYPHMLNFKKVRIALGFHPMISGNKRFDEELFTSQASKTSYIGEIGLDFSKADNSERANQITTLKKVLRIINNRPRFISLHSRKAESVLLDLLKESGIRSAVFHWYSGPLTLIDRVVSAGHYFSINPAMIRANKGRRIIERIPPERVLTETDGPYVKVKGLPAEPGDVELIIDHLRNVWDKSFRDAEKTIESNFRRLMGMPMPV